MEPGEFVVVPKGVEHKPLTDGESGIPLFERVGAVNSPLSRKWATPDVGVGCA